MKKPLILFLCIVTIGILLNSCAVNPVTGKTQLMLMTESQEIAMGADYDPKLVASFGLYEDPKILGFIEKKGAEMGKIGHRPNLTYHFRILDSPVVNAFAVPGGYIYLTRGILAQLNNEAELMAVIGHEMGHINARHSASQQSKSMLGQILLLGGSAVSERFAQYANYTSTGLELVFLSFSRENEREADELGVEYTTKIGYDANKMADFFDVLNKMDQGGSSIPTFLSTHPSPTDRNALVKASAVKWQTTVGNQSWLVNSDEYLQLIDGLVYGEDPRRGYVEGSTFYHPKLGFQFIIPTDWSFENAASQISMAPKDGSAILAFMKCDEKSVTEAEASGIKGLGLTNTTKTMATLNGFSVLTSEGDQVSTNTSSGAQTVNKVLSQYIDYNGTIYVFHALTGEADINTMKPIFEKTMKSFIKISDMSKLNVNPSRLTVATVPNSGILSDVMTNLGVPKSKLEEIALLNNLDLSSRVEKGKLIKIVTK